MVHYGSLTPLQSFLMGTVVILSNLSAIPSIYSLLTRPGLQFQALITISAIGTSALYHMCQVLDCDLFMSEEQWHRLDNVFAIAGIGVYVLHLLGNGHARRFVYATVFVSVITQEKDPWNVWYTFGTVGFFQVLAVGLRVYYWCQGKVQVKYNFKRMIASIVILVIAGQFFISGLSEHEDYLRINHGLWHAFAGVAHYYGMNCTTYRHKGNGDWKQLKDVEDFWEKDQQQQGQIDNLIENEGNIVSR